MPIEGIHQSLHSNHRSVHSEHSSHRSHFDASSTTQDHRKIIIGESGRQYILTNEAPVIVSNKEAAAMAMLSSDDLESPFANSFSQIDQTVLQDIAKTNSSRINDQHDLDQKIQANVSKLIHYCLENCYVNFFF